MKPTRKPTHDLWSGKELHEAAHPDLFWEQEGSYTYLYRTDGIALALIYPYPPSTGYYAHLYDATGRAPMGGRWDEDGCIESAESPHILTCRSFVEAKDKAWEHATTLQRAGKRKVKP